MPCFSPKRAFYTDKVNPDTGLFKVTLNPVEGFVDWSMEIPCGECIGCRKMQARDWGNRSVLESRLHETNIFMTVTYATPFLPRAASGRPTLVPDDFTLFMKRYRKWLGKVRPWNPTVRYFLGSEYGERFGRPHGHYSMFGAVWPDDARRVSESKRGFPQFESRTLNGIWGKGFVRFSWLNHRTCFYAAGYALKGQSGPLGAGDVVPAFHRESRRPGLGAGAFDRWSDGWYPSGQLVMDGRRVPTPRYFDERLKARDVEAWRRMKVTRRLEARKRWHGDVMGSAAEYERERKYLCAVEALKRVERDFGLEPELMTEAQIVELRESTLKFDVEFGDEVDGEASVSTL
jgi:hypothetical protein